MTSGRTATQRRLRRSLPILGAFAVGAVAYGTLYTFPTVAPAFAEEFRIGRTVAVTPWTMFLLVSGLSSPFIGRAYDVFFDRQLLTAGVLVLAAGWLAAANAPDIGILIAAYGILLALGLQLIFVGISTAIARRYAGVAGLALGVAYAGPGIGVAVALPLVAPVIGAYGWRTVLDAFAAISLLGLPFVLLMTSGPAIVVPVRRPAAQATVTSRPAADLRILEAEGGLHEASAPGAIGAAMEPPPHGRPVGPLSLRRTLRTRRFWLLFAGAMAIGTVDEGMYQAFVPHATAHGIAPDVAAAALGLQSITYVAGQVLGGAVSDRFGRRRPGLGVALVSAVGVIGVSLGSGEVPAAAVLGIAAVGFGLGATIAIRSAAFSDVFAGHDFGAIFGILAIAYPVGGIVSVYAGGLGFDSIGSYAPVFGLSLAGLVLWSVALWVAGPRRHGRAAARAPESAHS